MFKEGSDVIIAAPDSEYAQIVPGFMRISAVRMFGKIRLLSSAKLRKVLKNEKNVIVAFDGPSETMLKRLKIGFKSASNDIGVNLSIYSPANVSPGLQNQFLDNLNIVEHQKMLTVISQLGVNIDVLLAALRRIDRDDFIIALHGKGSRMQAGRIMRNIRKNGCEGKILFLGKTTDMATLLRASFAIVSLNLSDSTPLREAIAMGRPCIWPESEGFVLPNLIFYQNDPDNLARAIENCLNMQPAARTRIENQNLRAAENFSMDILVDKIKRIKK